MRSPPLSGFISEQSERVSQREENARGDENGAGEFSRPTFSKSVPT
jgi:hypothetical protein